MPDPLPTQPLTDATTPRDEASLIAALQNERRRLAEVVELSPAFIVVLRGADYVFEITNANYLALIGRHDVIGRRLCEELPEVAGQGFIGLLDEVRATGKPYRGNEVPVQLSRGPGGELETRYLNFVFQPLREADGTVSGVFVHGIDLTESVVARDAIRASEARYRYLFESIDVGFCVVEMIFDPTGRAVDYRYLEVNPAFEKQTGLTNMSGRRVREILPAHEEHWLVAYGNVARTGDPSRFENHAAGLNRWFDVYAFRVGEPSQHRVAILFKDTTINKLVERSLRESEARFRNMSDHSPVMIWLTRADGYCEYLNKRWYAFTGQSEIEAQGFGWLKAVHPDDAPHAEATFIEANAKHTPFYVEYRLLRADGIYRFCVDAAAPRFDADGVFVGFVGSVIDITDRAVAEQERERLLVSERAARAEAELASKMKDEFLATLSHELRTPLSAILGWSQLLTRANAKPEMLAEGLKTIERNARSQTQIIDDLLDMSRIVSGKISIEARRTDLSGVVRAAIETVRPAAVAKEITIRFYDDAPDRRPIFGDPNRLQQVFWNLLSNAIKFTPRGGIVELRIEQRHSQWQVDVSDTGEGIAEELMPFVFDRFRQGDSSTTRRHGGLGLGLAIVRQLVELHGGRVRARSDGPGKGSTFTVSLPVSVIHDVPGAAIGPDEAGHVAATLNEGVTWDASLCDSIRGQVVLVVDDEPDARTLIRQLLEECGARVLTAETATEALAVIVQDRPDVLVSDIGMPGEDGYTLLRRVRALGAHRGGNVPAIALTAYARADDRVKAIRAGFQMHIPKPVEPAELITMVASLMPPK